MDLLITPPGMHLARYNLIGNSNLQIIESDLINLSLPPNQHLLELKLVFNLLELLFSILKNGYVQHQIISSISIQTYVMIIVLNISMKISQLLLVKRANSPATNVLTGLILVVRIVTLLITGNLTMESVNARVDFILIPWVQLFVSLVPVN